MLSNPNSACSLVSRSSQLMNLEKDQYGITCCALRQSASETGRNRRMWSGCLQFPRRGVIGRQRVTRPMRGRNGCESHGDPGRPGARLLRASWSGGSVSACAQLRLPEIPSSLSLSLSSILSHLPIVIHTTQPPSPYLLLVNCLFSIFSCKMAAC